jgi:hypothetical protein
VLGHTSVILTEWPCRPWEYLNNVTDSTKNWREIRGSGQPPRGRRKAPRAQIAPERIDLMVLRGYAYMKLNRLSDARRVFEATAAAGTGSRDAIRGLADLRNMQAN